MAGEAWLGAAREGLGRAITSRLARHGSCDKLGRRSRGETAVSGEETPMRKLTFLAATVAALALVASTSGEAKAQYPWGTTYYYTAPANGYYYAPGYAYTQTYRYTTPAYTPYASFFYTNNYPPPPNMVYYSPMSYAHA